MTTLDRAVLRSMLGPSYFDMLRIGELLDNMARRGVISSEGLSTVLDHLAEELVASAVANDVCKGLSGEAKGPDTSTSEAP